MFCAVRCLRPTRVLSTRQLPTDHDHAVPTREYQSDQSSRQPLGCHRCCCSQRYGGWSLKIELADLTRRSISEIPRLRREFFRKAFDVASCWPLPTPI